MEPSWLLRQSFFLFPLFSHHDDANQTYPYPQALQSPIGIASKVKPSEYDNNENKCKAVQYVSQINSELLCGFLDAHKMFHDVKMFWTSIQQNACVSGLLTFWQNDLLTELTKYSGGGQQKASVSPPKGRIHTYSFCSNLFGNLQDVRTFAPLESSLETTKSASSKRHALLRL